MPTRGTTPSRPLYSWQRSFQSTCPRGARLTATIIINIVNPFQSTCPRGARPSSISLLSSTTYFNPRAHEGHDRVRFSVPPEAVFQSTCPRGARRRNTVLRCKCRYFNPRAHEGHDSKQYIRLILVYISTAQFGTLEQTIIQ